MDRACQEHATRILANALVNTCWRNTEAVEGLHAGYSASYPLDHCRLTRVEEHRLVDEVCGAFVYGLKAIHTLAAEESDRTWPQRVQPFGSMLFVAPAGWSLDEVTRLVVFQEMGG